MGTGPEAQALRHHLESIRHLGYTFKGFIDSDGCAKSFSDANDVLGTLETLFHHTRRQFVDEIFFTSPTDQGIVRDVLEKARVHGVDLRLVPDFYGGLAWSSPIEYIGQFPTIPLHCGSVPEAGLMLKRLLDVTFSAFTLLLLSPFLFAVALAIKLDSKGPVFIRFRAHWQEGTRLQVLQIPDHGGRTLKSDAPDMMHLNERDGVLFKVANDPRITTVGTFPAQILAG